MTLIKTIEHKFEEIKLGNTAAQANFFETLWVNSTRIAYHPDSKDLLEKIHHWAENNKDTHFEFYELTLLTRGFLEFLSDRFDIAMELLDKVFNIYTAKNDEDGIASTSICIGFLHRSRGELNMALSYGLAGMEQLAKSGNFKMFRVIGSYWLGSVYTETGHLDEAVRLFNEGLNSGYQPGVKSLGARLTNGLGNVYMKQERYAEALDNYQKALELLDHTTEKTFEARGLTDLGDYYSHMQNYPLAIKYNLDALHIRQEMNVKNGSITNMMNLGQLYCRQNQFNEAVEILNHALQLAEEIKLKVKMYPIHQLLSDIYKKNGNYAEALTQYTAFHEIKEEINHEDLQRKVNNQVKLFEAQQIEKENVIIKAQSIEIEKEKKRSDELLRNILPEEVAEELKNKGTAEARQFDEVTVLFTDFKNFTGISSTLTPTELVEEIHTCFKAFDEIIEKHNIEKIKTIGDSYMCVAGLPLANSTHAFDAVLAGLEIRDFVDKHIIERQATGKEPFQVRIGIHTGPVVAGIVGIRKFAYDIWGDTVNTASRMESGGEAGKVNISASTYELVKDKFTCTYRGKIQAKGKGEIDMYFVEP